MISTRADPLPASKCNNKCTACLALRCTKQSLDPNTTVCCFTQHPCQPTFLEQLTRIGAVVISSCSCSPPCLSPLLLTGSGSIAHIKSSAFIMDCNLSAASCLTALPKYVFFCLSATDCQSFARRMFSRTIGTYQHRPPRSTVVIQCRSSQRLLQHNNGQAHICLIATDNSMDSKVRAVGHDRQRLYSPDTSVQGVDQFVQHQ